MKIVSSSKTCKSFAIFNKSVISQKEGKKLGVYAFYLHLYKTQDFLLFLCLFVCISVCMFFCL